MRRKSVKICPYCGQEYTQHSEISHLDYVTPLCPFCANYEALNAFGFEPCEIMKLISRMRGINMQGHETEK